MKKQWEIDKKYLDMADRYVREKDTALKIQMKYRFVQWMKENSCELTDAERDYLEATICYVEDLHDW